MDIVLPGNLQYSAVRNAASGAPFRPITVRDTIADLPPVGNGADKTEINVNCFLDLFNDLFDLSEI